MTLQVLLNIDIFLKLIFIFEFNNYYGPRNNDLTTINKNHLLNKNEINKQQKYIYNDNKINTNVKETKYN